MVLLPLARVGIGRALQLSERTRPNCVAVPSPARLRPGGFNPRQRISTDEFVARKAPGLMNMFQSTTTKCGLTCCGLAVGSRSV